MKSVRILFLIIIVMGTASTVSQGTETQQYETLYKKDKFEIRYYPAAVMASVKMKGSYDDMKNQGFRTLAGYIFGDNRQNQKISMTSPVRVEAQGKESTMSFIMPSAMELETLPQPANVKIKLHETQPVYTASIRFGGYSGNKKIEDKKEELKQILNKFNIEHNSRFAYLGYNSPFKIFNRRNEVIVYLTDFNPDKIENITAQK